MKLTTASNVCKKINEDAVYAFLFEPTAIESDDKADAFIDKFANDHNLEATTVAPNTWAFSHKLHGHLNDGVIELDMQDTKPVFKLRDVSDAKITVNSPDFDDDLRAVNQRIMDAKIEYIGKLKNVVKNAKESIDGLSRALSGNKKQLQSDIDIDIELEDLQKRYHMAMDRLREIQGSTEEDYETLKAGVEMSLISLKYSIENTVSKIDSAS